MKKQNLTASPSNLDNLPSLYTPSKGAKNKISSLQSGKKILLLSCFIFAILSAFAQTSYTVKIKLSNFKNYTPSILYSVDEQPTANSTYTNEDGWMVFKGDVKEPTLAKFVIRGNPASFIATDQGIIPGPVYLEFFLTNEEIKINGDADKIYMCTVEGGKANAEWASIKPELNQLSDQSWTAKKKAYSDFKSSNDSLVFKNESKISTENTEKAQQLKLNFIKKNPNALVSMYFLSGMINNLKIETLKETYDKLGEEHKNSKFAKLITAKISKMESTSAGKKAIDFQKTDINGKTINLETLKGKYTLLDFWGSWCVPCRASHPQLKLLYNKYKTSGFEILGIALEEGKALNESTKTWKAAIKQDGLNWLQILNNEGIEQFDIVKAYGITVFPTKILLDKEGKIIARYDGEHGDIEAKLKEIFGK